MRLERDIDRALGELKNKRGLVSPRIRLLGTRGKIKIYLVDGEKARVLYADWTMGGHDLVYPKFIPRNEVWIAAELGPTARKMTLIHELYERRLMSHGMTYNAAHEKALDVERFYRANKYRGLDEALRKERGQ